MFAMIIFDDSANLKATDDPLQSITAPPVVGSSRSNPVRVRCSTLLMLNSMIS